MVATMYTEQESTCTFNSKEYDLTSLLTVTGLLPTMPLLVGRLAWMTDHGTPDESRVLAADLDTPILVTILDGQFAVIDGFHRLTKALRMDKALIKVIIVPMEMLEQYLIVK